MRLWERLLAGLTGLLLAAGLLVLAGSALGRPLLMAAVPTGSMQPALEPGDLIPILPLWASGPVAEGTVIVFRQPNGSRWIVHRVVGGDAISGFITQGDANPAPDDGRVQMGDIAGVVPQRGEAVLRIPHVGKLATSAGPLANPIVALVTGVVGLWLLTEGRERRRTRPVRREVRALAAYGGLILTAFLATMLPAWSLSSRVTLRYSVVEERPATVQTSGIYLPGEAYHEEVALKNPSLVPILIFYLPDDSAIRFDRTARLLWPGQTASLGVTVQQTELGVHESSLFVGVFLPLLPPPLLLGLARIHLGLAALAVSLVPTLLLLGISLLDLQFRRGLTMLWHRVLLAVE